eukprot:TRINITY_DN30217_c0_g1_i1.p1 TRINITY_DN30217_c0_g1~~TRINITY_DN30217_c0_g1_i1.p1  ORF type:complete len:292 (+),score=53.52 TRINITY_DN30217_c0_g1_i1:281-1156(+)
MSIVLQVEAPGLEPGHEVAVVGAEAALGEWDTAKAVRLSCSTEDGVSTWRCEMAAPSPGTEFKLISVKSTGEVSWEPLPDDSNRSWPSTALAPGTICKTRYGEKKLAIETSLAHIEANARSHRKLEARAGSALQANLDKQGDLAYYHAHNRHFEVPADAKVITGPGLIAGGAPVLLEAGADKLDPASDERIVPLKEYSWCDSGAKVKVYVTVPANLLPAEGAAELVSCDFGEKSLDLEIKKQPRHKLSLEKLNAEIKPEECTTRVEPQKNRIVLQLVKKKESTWYNLTKSK